MPVAHPKLPNGRVPTVYQEWPRAAAAPGEDPQTFGPHAHPCLVSCPGDSVEISGEAVEDLVGGLGPHERPRVVVPGGDPDRDRGGELADRAVGAALEPLAGQLGKPPLDQVQP